MAHGQQKERGIPVAKFASRRHWPRYKKDAAGLEF